MASAGPSLRWSRLVYQLACVLAGLLLVPVSVAAQTEGASIAGTVRDTSGAVLPGVTVEAASPVLIEKVRSVVTDSGGQYRVVSLRPGTYTVTFTLPGFNTVKVDGVSLAGSFVASVNVELKVGGLEETITVTGQSPVVDVQSVSQQRSLGKDVIDTIPTGRTHYSIANLVPALSTSTPSDVGGSTAIAHTTLTSHGGRSGDMRVTVDGLSTHNYEGGESLTGYLPNMTSTQEVTVDYAAGLAERSTGGVAINLIPRDGGNRFSLSFAGNLMMEDWQNNNVTKELLDRGLGTPNELHLLYDFNPGVGGPIVKDKVWFYSSARRYKEEHYVGGLFFNANAGNPNIWTYAPDTTSGRRLLYKSLQKSLNGRVTWQANAKHKLAVFVDDQFRCWCPRNNALTSWPENNNSSQYPVNTLGQVSWTAPLTNRLLVESAYMKRMERWRYIRPAAGSPELSSIGVLEQSTGMLYHGGPPQSADTQPFATTLGDLNHLRGSLSYVTGSHAFKVGFLQHWATRTQDALDDEVNMMYRFNNGVPNQITLRATPFTRIDKIRADLGIYAQDKWTMDRTTLSVGLRFDYLNTYSPEQSFGPGRWVPNRNVTFPETQAAKWLDLTPRMGVVHDLFGNGKTALKASLNKYTSGVDTNSSQSLNPIVRMANTVTRAWTDANGNYKPDCDLLNLQQQDLRASGGDLCGVVSNLNFGNPIPSTNYLEADLRGWSDRPYNWEMSAGVQHEILPQTSVDVSYFRRWYGNFVATDNTLVGPANYGSFTVTAPADSRLPNGGGYAITQLLNLNPDKVGQVNNVVSLASRYGKQIEHWNGIDAGINRRFSSGMLIQGGISTGRRVTDNCDIQKQLPELNPLGGPYCHADYGILTQVKAFGSYVIPKGDIQLSVSYANLPGTLLSANFTATNAMVTPSLGRPLTGATTVSVNLLAPGDMYGDRLNKFDLRVGKLFKFGSTRTSLSLDIFNLLNDNAVLTESSAYATWRQPQEILQSRFVKFNWTFDF